MVVIKRDATEVPFDKSKISSAVLKAFAEVDDAEAQYAIDKANEIASYVEKQNYKSIEVEQIQDIVVRKLMNSQYKDVAIAYIKKREQRELARQGKSSLMKEIGEKIRADNVQNQNANVDEKSFGGRMGEANDVLLKDFALNHCMSKMARDNHINNRIYTHDLGHYAAGDHNCLSIPFDKLLANGFNTRQTDVRPANSINTAFQLVAVIFQLQSLQQFGRQNTAC